MRELRKPARSRILTSWACSGGRFERRVTLGRSRAAALRASRGSTTGFRGLRRGAYDRQECRETPQDAGRSQPPGPLRSLPGQPSVGNPDARQPELGIGGHDQPGPPVGLLGKSEPGSTPAQGLLHEAYSVIEVEPAAVRLPDEIEVRLPLPAPPQPQLLGLAGLPRVAKLVYLSQFLFCGLPSVAPYCARGGIRVVSTPP